MLWHSIIGALALPLLTGAVTLPQSGNSPLSSPLHATAGEPCTSLSDCHSYNQICHNGLCTRCTTVNQTAVACYGQSCNARIPCSAGFFCFTGICTNCQGWSCPQPPVQKCTTHSQCAVSDGRICEPTSKSCVECYAYTGCPGWTCVADADCYAGLVCAESGETKTCQAAPVQGNATGSA